MPTYLYCLLPPGRGDATPLGAMPAGIGGVPVRALPLGRLVAWVSDVAMPIAAGSELAADHARVLLAALASGGTPLPARSGQHFADDAMLRGMVATREAAFVSALERLAGRVEMTLHLHLAGGVASDDASPAMQERSSSPPGRAYLERRRTELERTARDLHHSERLRAVARAALDDLVERDACLAVRDGRGYILSHLVKRETAEAWRVRARALRLDGVAQTFVAGPLPPCSFASIDDTAP